MVFVVGVIVGVVGVGVVGVVGGAVDGDDFVAAIVVVCCF